MNNQHQNREEDSFYDYFKDSLEEHQLSVDEKCWENINQRITPTKRTNTLRILWTGVAAVACALLILVFVLRTNSPLEQQIVQDDNIGVENSLETRTVPTENKKGDVQSDNITKVTSQEKKTVVKRNSSKVTVATNEESANLSPKIEQGQISEKTSDQDIIVAEKKEDEKAMEIRKDSLPKKNKIDNLDFYKEDDVLFLASNSNKGGGWELSASVAGSGSSSNLSQGHVEIKTAPMFSDAAAGPMLGSKSISDIEYAPPFSVGILVRKGFNKTFGIETGLTYSYLSTSYKDVNNQFYSANLKLHYIGVPVNLVANVWNITPQWKLYASTGVMIEKGIKSDFSQQVSKTEQKITQSESIKGVQWSVNASIGVSYKFYQGWNAYLEPRVSHYFDNNQPLSIRTEKKTIIGINAGFRYEF